MKLVPDRISHDSFLLVYILELLLWYDLQKVNYCITFDYDTSRYNCNWQFKPLLWSVHTKPKTYHDTRHKNTLHPS